MTEKQDVDGVLAGWRDAFNTLNTCPWPGPRPIRGGRDQHLHGAVEEPRGMRGWADPLVQLRGRQELAAEVAIACLSNDLLVVHGQSGVGKTSLIEAGLVDELEHLGKTVLRCSTWGTDDPDITPSEHVARGAGLEKDPFAEGLSAVDRDYPDRLVLVLDQFEELIRNNESFAHEVVRWIEETAGRTSAKFVISLRSEYEHQLRDLYTRPFTRRSRIEIPPITSLDVVRLIVEGDLDDPDTDPMPIASEAVQLIADLWRESLDDDRETVWNRPGLLHLQATLYVLWMRRTDTASGESGLGLVSVDDVAKLVADLESPGIGTKATNLLHFGLEQSVAVSIDTCVTACEPRPPEHPAGSWRGVPKVISDQARWMFRDVTERLASGGYKTPQDIWELAEQIIPGTTCPPPEWIVRHFAEGVDWLGCSRSDISAVVETASARLDSMASGPAAGLSDSALQAEMHRAFFFAVEWLCATSIVQVLPSDGSRVVSLTHDRYSEGLAQWRTGEGGSFDEAVWRFVHHRGDTLRWPDEVLEGRTVYNVQWLASTISDTTFRSVSFVNCSFAGSTFQECVFEDVTFVNCVLDKVAFDECTIVGHAAWPDRADLQQLSTEVVETPPVFQFPVDTDTARRLTDLAGADGWSTFEGKVHVVSGTSGLVAQARAGVAVDRDPRTGPQLPLPDSTGGLTMCGGRLSALMFRGCVFAEDESAVSLRHVAGTSLEICDQKSGRFDVFAAAIRGLTVTLPVDDREAAGSAFVFDFHRAKLINTWFGVGLTGAATLDDCLVWQLMNASQAGFSVAVVNSGHYGLVNATPGADAESPELSP